ncbi:ANXA2R isoform 2 [Pan troglodytes]|uniref:ANXA2R isoform 1 n=1 Tax=Pan troglodytes TaxID=9598 RepID=A0A2J8KR69_PANTR|nr:ANXA2R isoform 1 [Pan troglodytes]PNI37525.1 ANXA2R isoform 2 [Pan troglodytes]
MEQHFLGCVKRAWDSAEVAPEPQPPPIVSSEDRGPWPLPLYPVLGEYSLDSCDLGLLSSPCWRLPGVYWQNGLFPGVQSTLEPSTAKPTEFSWPGTQKQQEAPVEEVGQAEEPDRLRLQQLPWSSPLHPWDRQQDTRSVTAGAFWNAAILLPSSRGATSRVSQTAWSGFFALVLPRSLYSGRAVHGSVELSSLR